jgi:L-lactate dehydrogenase complex protein LldE
MPIALFVPCYVDQMRPAVGIAALDVLEALGVEVVYPEDQTCCGQPFASAGEIGAASALGRHYLDVFEGFDTIVSLSGSCAATMRLRLPSLVADPRATRVAARTREFCEFLVETGAADGLRGRFPHRVGLHSSCHALRDLRLGNASETRDPERIDPARRLLTTIDDLEIVDLTRRDECCGFGGVFSIEEEAVSCRMGLDRLADHRAAGAEIIASSDLSCLMHLDGLARKQDQDVRTLHIAEILAASLVNEGARDRGASTHSRARGIDGSR